MQIKPDSWIWILNSTMIKYVSLRCCRVKISEGKSKCRCWRDIFNEAKNACRLLRVFRSTSLKIFSLVEKQCWTFESSRGFMYFASNVLTTDTQTTMFSEIVDRQAPWSRDVTALWHSIAQIDVISLAHCCICLASTLCEEERGVGQRERVREIKGRTDKTIFKTVS